MATIISTHHGSRSARGVFSRRPFHRHPLLRFGHLQTVAALWMPGRRYPYRAQRHVARLSDGDALVLHDDRPPAWREGDAGALLIHGLMGCHQSHYMVRLAARLAERGLRVFRLDLRGSGAGLPLAKKPFHSGCTGDVLAALRRVAELCPDSPLSLAGFSLGGNLVLKVLGEHGDEVPVIVRRALAVCPPIDLPLCSENLTRGAARLYDRHFIRETLRRMKEREQKVPGAEPARFERRPRTMWEFDVGFTSRVWGYGTAENYYRQASALAALQNIRVPAAIIASDDDPVVPVSMFDGLTLSPQVELCVTRGGGHLGFIAARNGDPDRRWLDWRIVEWAVDGEGGSQ
ncbi:MAG: alpha/beta fold hydrolase [Planctomycetia bacterium]|nr:alpha/beta fold hydrolase [Planctomycetia bacterium]